MGKNRLAGNQVNKIRDTKYGARARVGDIKIDGGVWQVRGAAAAAVAAAAAADPSRAGYRGGRLYTYIIYVHGYIIVGIPVRV